MKHFGKAPIQAKRQKKMARLSGLTETLIAPALVKRSGYLRQLIAHWPRIMGPLADWAQPADVIAASSDGARATLVLSVRSGRGPEAQARAEEIMADVNRLFGFALIGQLRIKQDLPAKAPTESQAKQIQERPPAADLTEQLTRLGEAIAKKQRSSG